MRRVSSLQQLFLIALTLLGDGALLQVLHDQGHSHQLCALHGDWMDVHEEDESLAPLIEVSDLLAYESASAHSSDEHQHCWVSKGRVSDGVRSQPVLIVAHNLAIFHTEPSGIQLNRSQLYRIAPKNSPPTA